MAMRTVNDVTFTKHLIRENWRLIRSRLICQDWGGDAALNKLELAYHGIRSFAMRRHGAPGHG